MIGALKFEDAAAVAEVVHALSAPARHVGQSVGSGPSQHRPSKGDDFDLARGRWLGDGPAIVKLPPYTFQLEVLLEIRRDLFQVAH